MIIYYVDTPYAYCEFFEKEETLYVDILYKTYLEEVSAIHIHSAVDSNPILVWLASSHKWNNGVAQTAFQSNAPCCQNSMCNLVSPFPSTPMTDTIRPGDRYRFQIRKPANCSQENPCPWISEGTLFNVHGYNFQSYERCRLSEESAGADMIYSTPFLSKTVNSWLDRWQ